MRKLERWLGRNVETVLIVNLWIQVANLVIQLSIFAIRKGLIQ
jgi:hypothetical protein